MNPGEKRILGSLYRNEVTRCFTVMDVKDFQGMTCTFTCGMDPRTKTKSKQEFPVDMFNMLPPSDEPLLFKLAAKQAIDMHLENGD